MIRFAVQWPNMLMQQPEHDFNGARHEFIRTFKPVLYMPNARWRLTRGVGMRKLFRESPLINPDECEFAFSEGELNRKADILIHFNQFPLDLDRLAPPRGFRGLKVWHIFEYVFHASAVNRLLEDNGVDYLLGYADHGRHCPFFQAHYPRFVERVIPFPFGASQRFLIDESHDSRLAKVIALGSINLVNEPGGISGSLTDYAAFYAHKRWTHEWRRMLLEHESELADVMDSQLPRFPEMKNPRYDAVKMMTQYSLFANDEGLLAFPPARTFEGPGAGCVMMSSNHPCYSDLGFRDGENCVMHLPLQVHDFHSQARFYLEKPDQLKRIAQAGRQLVHTHYNHKAIAARLASQLRITFSTGQKPSTILATTTYAEASPSGPLMARARSS